MPTDFGFCFRMRPNAIDNSGVLHMWIEYRGSTVYMPTHYAIREHEWNAVSGRIVTDTGSTGRSRRLKTYTNCMARDLHMVGNIVDGLTRSQVLFTADEIANAFATAMAGLQMLSVYVTMQADELERLKQSRTARAYHTTVRRLISFNGGRDVELGNITPEMMSAFQCLLISEGVSRTTVSFYMRTLRAIYNKAVMEGVVPPRIDPPFGDVYTDVVIGKRKP